MLCSDSGVKESSFFSEMHGMNFDSCFFVDFEHLLERSCSLQSETRYEMEEAAQSLYVRTLVQKWSHSIVLKTFLTTSCLLNEVLLGVSFLSK